MCPTLLKLSKLLCMWWLQARCQELELQVTEAHFDREELESQMDAHAASAQQQAAAQEAKHKQQVKALQQQVEELAGLLAASTGRAGAAARMQGPGSVRAHPFVAARAWPALRVRADVAPAPFCTQQRQLVQKHAVRKYAADSAGQQTVLQLRQHSTSVGPMMAAKQRQQQHPLAVLAAVQRLQDRPCAGMDSASMRRTVQHLPAGYPVAGKSSNGGQVTSAGERRAAVSTIAAGPVAGHKNTAASASVLAHARRRSPAAGGSTPEPWYPGGASQGLMRSPATSSNGSTSRRTSNSSTGSGSSYKSSRSCFSGR